MTHYQRLQKDMKHWIRHPFHNQPFFRGMELLLRASCRMRDEGNNEVANFLARHRYSEAFNTDYELARKACH